jgi:hypothetical protein
VLFILLFVFVIRKPLTIGIMKQYYEVKIQYLSKLQNQKLIILAGSNGRFSHSCKVIQESTGIDCSNMSIAANISLDYQFDVLKPYLKRGDIVYLPLEYGALKGNKKELMAGLELPYIMSYDHDRISTMGFDRLLHGLFYFDLKYMLSGLGEMSLQRLGVKRRFNLNTLTKNGDEQFHTEHKGREYSSYLRKLQWKAPTIDYFDDDSYKVNVVRLFLQWAKQKGIKVVGGLPTTFNDQPIPENLITSMRRFYLDEGHDFLLLSNNSQYPRHFFYDTAYHLNERNQKLHSIKIGEHISLLLRKNNQLGSV